MTRALTFFAERIRQSATLQALYVHGSLVQGGFRAGRSDIDFVGVADSRINQPAVSDLRRLHTGLRLRFPRQRFNGCYVTADTFIPALYVDGLGFSSAPHTAWNEVTRFELATCAVPLFGPPGSAVVGPADVSSLLRYVAENMNDYWVKWVDRTSGLKLVDTIAAIVVGRRIEWGVLGVSRQFYTLRERDVISKEAAGEYMLRCAPAEHHPILLEALRLRSGHRTSRYVNWWARRRDAVAYMRWVIGEANRTTFPERASRS